MPTNELSLNSVNQPSWQSELRDARLATDAFLKGLHKQPAARHQGTFTFFATQSYLNKINLNDLDHCPIYLQVFGSHLETDTFDASITGLQQLIRPQALELDPIGDLSLAMAPRITHRYHDRVLVHAAEYCAVNCRFCFRKHHLAAHTPLYESAASDLLASLTQLNATPQVNEIIFTGGDVFTYGDVWFERLAEVLESLSYIRIVRFHSRVPVVLPTRFNDDLLQILTRINKKKRVHIVTHFNHTQEIDGETRHYLAGLKSAVNLVMNQSVLLDGVNDSVAALRALSDVLIDNGVIPYYLHHTDQVPQTSGFRVPIARGQALMQELTQQVSPIAAPKYVLDIPSGSRIFSKAQTEILSNEARRTQLMAGALSNAPEWFGYGKINLQNAQLETLDSWMSLAGYQHTLYRVRPTRVVRAGAVQTSARTDDQYVVYLETLPLKK